MTPSSSVAIFVDGTNVFASRPDGWWRNRSQAAARLVDALDRLCDRTRRSCTVVFDRLPRNCPPPPSTTRVRVRAAARSGRDAADDMIVDLVAGLPEPHRAFVYTSDRRLRSRLHALGARTAGAGALRARLDGRRTGLSEP